MPRDHAPPRLGDRSLFQGLEPRAYLNHAGISPPSIAVREAVLSLLLDYGRHGSKAFLHWSEQRARLRGRLGELVGARAENLALVPNTSLGLSAVALCFPWKQGDRVLAFRGEFPANVTPWQRAAEAFGLEVVLLSLEPFTRSIAEGLAELERELSRGARLVTVSYVEFQTGLRMPIAEMATLAHRYGAELCVDGVQGLGVVPVDVTAMGVDYFAAGAHKWLMGLEGAGLLYVRPGRADKLRPLLAGWLSHEDAWTFLFSGGGLLRYDRPIRKSIDFLEGGNVSATGFAALEASVELLLELGIPAIYGHVSAYLDALELALTERGFSSLRSKDPAQRSGILSVLPPAGGPSVLELADALQQRGVACATPDGRLRFSPHWPNHLDELPFVTASVDALLAR
jgi:cysteine desulfurase/selenocysteine lyase